MPVDMSQISVSFKGVQASTIFLEPIFMDKTITEYFQVLPDIQNGKQKMLFAGQIDNILRQRKGCGFSPVGDMPINERCISTTEVKGETAQCWEEFKHTILIEALNTGVRRGDLTGTVMQNILLDRLQKSVIRQVNLLAFFGDKASGNPEQNIVDGLWTVYLPQLVAQNLTARVDSKSGIPLGAGDAEQLLDDVYDASSNELYAFDNSEKIMLVTREVWEQLRKDYRNNTAGSCCYLEQAEDGRQMLMYNGIEVKAMSRWEGLAAQYMGDILPKVKSNFNLVLYTHRRNLVMGTNLLSDINRFETWFERKEEEYLTRTAFELGFNYVHPSLMTVAY